MGLFSLLSFLVVTSLGTLYPIYLSYKAIKNNDLQSLEVLLMFWIVIGIINALESTFGWLLHWIPFFYEFKSVFMLWLTLPQIQGSTYMYLTYVHPFLLEHEVEIDTWLVEMKQKCRTTGTTYFYQFIDKLKQALLTAMLPPTDPRHPNSHHDQRSTSQQNQIDGASAYTMNLIRQFGPAASAFFQPMQNRLPDSFHLGQPNYPRGLLQVPNSNPMPPSQQSSQSSSSLQSQHDGYQIPDYDEVLPSSFSSSVSKFPTRKSNEISNRSNESSVSRHPSSESLRTTHRLDRQNSSPSSQHRRPYNDKNNKSSLGFSGYEEIGKDEASGSEHEWLLRKPSPPLRSTSNSASSSLLNPRVGLSDGSQSNPSKSAASNDKASTKRNGPSSSSGSRWFPWSSSKTNIDGEESRKDK